MEGEHYERASFLGGTVVSAEGSYRADVLVEDEKIVAVGTNLDPDGAETVDASGKLVMPGFIDAHTHMDMPFGGPLPRTAGPRVQRRLRRAGRP